MKQKNKTWQKISNSEELICYEKNKEELSVRLEARSIDNKWIIYRGFFKDKLNYTEEYAVQTREEAEKMLDELKKEKDITSKELVQLVKKKNKKVSIKLKRAYREDAVEKWFFNVDNDDINNFFIIREGENIDIDIILNSKYKHKEDDIIEEISSSMSLEDLAIDIIFRIFYFNEFSEKINEGSKKIFNKFEIKFEPDD